MTLTSLARPSYMPKYKPDASCVLYLEGQQDPQSATIRDLSGKGNHGTLTGTTCERLSSGLWVNKFDGTDDFIDCGAGSSLDNLSSFTWEIWVKPTTISADHWLFTKRHVKNVCIDNAGALLSFIYDNAANPVSRSEVGTILVNNWFHVVCTYDDTGDRKMHFYVNGAEVSYLAQAAATGTLQDDSAYHYRIGHYQDSATYFTGQGGLSRIFNRALSATQIAGIFNQERSLFGV
jgi:hypothetical protein